MLKCWPEFHKLTINQPRDDEKLKPFFQELAKDVLKYKKRLGGNFVVAQAVPNRVLRDSIKEVLGPDGMFVVLRLSKETNAKRIEARHSEGDNKVKKRMVQMLNSMYEMYEDDQPGEQNCVTVIIESEDSREDVANKILKKIEDFGFSIEL